MSELWSTLSRDVAEQHGPLRLLVQLIHQVDEELLRVVLHVAAEHRIDALDCLHELARIDRGRLAAAPVLLQALVVVLCCR